MEATGATSSVEAEILALKKVLREVEKHFEEWSDVADKAIRNGDERREEYKNERDRLAKERDRLEASIKGKETFARRAYQL